MEIFDELYWEIGMDFPEMIDGEEMVPVDQNMINRLDQPIYHTNPLKLYFDLDDYGMEGREYDTGYRYFPRYFTGLGILGAIKTFWDEPLTREELARIYPTLEPTLDITRRIGKVLSGQSIENIPRSEIANEVVFAGLEPYLDGYWVNYISSI